MDNILSLDVADIEDYALYHSLHHHRPKCVEHYMWKGIDSKFSFTKFIKGLNAKLPIFKLNDGHTNRYIYQIGYIGHMDQIFIEFKFRVYPGKGENNSLRAILYGEDIDHTLSFLHKEIIPYVDKVLLPFNYQTCHYQKGRIYEYHS